MWKTAYFAFFDHFWPFFGDIQNFGRVSGLQTFPRKKKKTTVFFFFLKQGKKKKTKFSEFEWVSERWTFPGKKKNTIPLGGGGGFDKAAIFLSKR